MNGFQGGNDFATYFDAAVGTYDTNAKKYTDYVDALKTDPSTTAVDKPSKPENNYSFTGWTFNSCVTDTAKTTLDKCKNDGADGWGTASGGLGHKDTTANLKTVWPNTKKASETTLGYSTTELAANFANRNTYIQVSPDETATLSPANTFTDATYVAHTFGRLGQGKDVDFTNGKPFLFEVSSGSSKKPGFQISLFPEVEGAPLDWTDWSGYTASVRTELKIKAIASNVSDLSVTASTKTAADITVTVGAQALAASLIASASIAATLF